MKGGTTGTQEGATRLQLQRLDGYLSSGLFTEWHHGDCIGADEETDGIAEKYGIRRVAHPPTNSSKRAFCKAELILPPRPYLDRNEDIVDAVDIMFGLPKGMAEEIRSGTWATIRYAKKWRKQLVILWPDGTETRLFIDKGVVELES